jgi:ribosome-associated protein
VQAIADEVDERLSKDMGVEPNAREGYNTAEWILLDYVDFVVHIFNAQRRAYYDLERLWKSAHKLTAEDLLQPKTAAARSEPEAPAVRKRAKKAPAKKAPGVRAAAKQSALGAGTKAPARKAAAKRTAGKKASAKKSAARPVGGKKSAGKKSGTKRR